MSKPLLVVALAAALALALGEPASGQSGAAHEYRRTHEHAIFDELVAFLAIPNVASDRANIRRNAEHLAEMIRRRGLEPRLLEGADPATPPAVYAEWRVPGATRTLVFYAHYDGQPVTPADWTTDPWTPTLRSGRLDAGGEVVRAPASGPIDPEWRVYGRSASDDKAGVMAILCAIDALRATGRAPTSNVRLFFEGEEEAGSPHLGEIVRANRELLGSDAWIICDGPVHQSGSPQVVFGVRGDTNVDVTVYGPRRPLHSGHYGNWATNPAMLLAKLLASMKDDEGRVTIAGWYDDVEPLGAAERRALDEVPDADDALREELDLARPDGGGKRLVELINLPSLNVNGMRSADVGASARNVIPTTASATLDLRLVRGNSRARQVARLVEHVRSRGYFVVDRDPTDAERRAHPLVAKITERPGGYDAQRTSMDLPVSLAVVAAVQSASSRPVVRMPTLGGSLPLSILVDAIGATPITVPIANYDNNQHAENENVRLGNLWDGIEVFAALMTMP